MSKLRMSEQSWWWVILGGFLYLGLVAVPSSRWIEVTSVHVNDAANPAEITLDVTREIKMFFPGVYSVTIRRSPGGSMICNTGSSLPIPYRPGAELPEPLPLWWWLGTVGDLRACAENGLSSPGLYMLETCHTVLRPFLGLVPEKTGCVDSNPFRIGMNG